MMNVEEDNKIKDYLEDKVLEYLSNHDNINNSTEFLQKLSDENKNYSFDILKTRLESVLGRLKVQYMVVINEIRRSYIKLSDEGDKYRLNGSPEFNLYKKIAEYKEEGASEADLTKVFDKKIIKIGKAQLMRARVIKFDKKNKKFYVLNEDFSDDVRNMMDDINQNQYEISNKQKDINEKLTGKVLDGLKKRKLIKVITEISYNINKGPKYARHRPKLYTDLTKELLDSNKWEEADFKEYNFDGLGQPLNCGALHPLLKVRSEFRRILLEMGFEEMKTNQFVESSFWNFDSLFQPQQHPARDSHDTFFLTKPANVLKLPNDEYVNIVKDTHMNGWKTGSIGYRYDWSLDEAKKNILRTHTTAVSSQVLYQLANSKEPFKPRRFFSIDRVFRNESLDATHLAEFHQVEGFIIDYNLTLGDLIGTIKTFFQRIDIDDVQFKPAYNPYTEPSMEIFGYSKSLKKWIEIGNSGIFRPEMLLPMGLPENVKVIAWGLSLERPTMLKYGLDNIRELFGPNTQLKLVANNPIPKFGSSQ